MKTKSQQKLEYKLAADQSPTTGCSHCLLWAQIFDQHEFDYENYSLGTIVEVFNDQNFLIKCNGGLLLVNDFEGNITLNNIGDTFFNGEYQLKKFELNEHGFHDL